MYNGIIFYAASFLLILFAALTLAFRNIVYSLISAMLVFFITAVIFLLLTSEYNAIIQLAIYGFAIPIILALGIMFTNFKREKPVKIEVSNSKYGTILICGIFILALVYIIMISQLGVPEIFSTQIILDDSPQPYSNFMIFAKGIFVKYVWAFELISLILTITAAGLTIIKKLGRKKI